MTTEQSKATEFLSNGGIMEVGVGLSGFQIQRLTLESPVAVMPDEVLRLEPTKIGPFGVCEVLVSITNTEMGVTVNTLMPGRLEDKV